jgi:hypothetical protein
MQYEINNDVLFKVLFKLIPVSLVIMITIAAAVYYTSEKAIAQVPVPYPYNLYPYYPYPSYPYPSYPYPTTADVYPGEVYPYNLIPDMVYPAPY